ncbi:transmembrane protein 254 [Latimeria chalumnae]|uniref:transmembrane protein 254 n=1 Tax=Latimeria chalumnae TaxID=7897 RepID=UPI00313EEB3C
MAESENGSYFRRTNLFWMAVITTMMGFFMWTVLWPTQVPLEKLGPFGTITKYLVDNHYTLLYYGFWLAWAIHVAEALYSLKVCSVKGITSRSTQLLWFLQTFLFGIASLSLLLAYKPDQRKKRG